MMRKGLGILAAGAAVILAVGCSDGRSTSNVAPGSSSDTGDAGDTSIELPDTDGTSADAATNPDTEDAAGGVDRNPLCGPADDGVYGTTLPWEGLEAEGVSFTCNTCPGGTELLQGSWRFIDFNTEDPNVDLGDYAEKLTFEGNTWTIEVEGDDLGQNVSLTAGGMYFCADPVELESGPHVFRVDSASPEGGFGVESGQVFAGGPLYQGSNKVAIFYSDTLTSETGYTVIYCRIGSTIETLAGAQVECSDPL